MSRVHDTIGPLYEDDHSCRMLRSEGTLFTILRRVGASGWAASAPSSAKWTVWWSGCSDDRGSRPLLIPHQASPAPLPCHHNNTIIPVLFDGVIIVLFDGIVIVKICEWWSVKNQNKLSLWFVFLACKFCTTWDASCRRMSNLENSRGICRKQSLSSNFVTSMLKNAASNK